ncbi:MAG: homoserine dehydrogenase, partial [Clostridia bacterium]|nr:homoserine dehydrogenase [Clostridia bacterium]
MRLAIVGFGGVGRALLKLIEDKKEDLIKSGLDLKVCYIVDIVGGVYDPNGINLDNLIQFLSVERDISLYPNFGSKDINFNTIITNNDIDLLVEMTPTNKETGEPGMTHIKESLLNGINVVTSNKGPILLAYEELSNIAFNNNVQLGIGCTTGGALPTINAGLFDMAGSNILSIEGVLNGTTNFILADMEENETTYEESLQKAQKLGIAETNPTLDVGGWDTASKLLILTNVLMNQNKKLSDMSIEGITEITPQDIKNAAAEGKKYKLVGKTQLNEDGVSMSVKLEKLDDSHSLYGVSGKNKAVKYTSDTLGDLTIIGGASGLIPAAASVLRDVINIHK